ncbi:MAG: type II toxin-antitoxin system HicA family toxin [Acidobacteria bacterium]|nr:type II toxin-antitoxin system HicA family toxin [Acidobacteriota bacterium]
MNRQNRFFCRFDLLLDSRTEVYDTEKVKAGEFLKKVRRYAKENNLNYRWVAAHGKGSHGTLFIGREGRTTVKDLKKELGIGAVRAMCKQLFIDPKEIV